MRCESCGEREATVHAVEIEEGSRTERWLCVECAEREGLISAAFAPARASEMSEYLGNLLRDDSDLEAGPDIEAAACPGCGRTLREIRLANTVGCARCYDAFRGELREMLRLQHGRTGHQGRLPSALGPAASLRREITRLKAEQDEAVLREDYEDAARLRDEINDHREQMRAVEDQLPGQGE